MRSFPFIPLTLTYLRVYQHASESISKRPFSEVDSKDFPRVGECTLLYITSPLLESPLQLGSQVAFHPPFSVTTS
jgi:hypothetical protein